MKLVSHKQLRYQLNCVAVHLRIIRIDSRDSLLPKIKLRKLLPRNQARVCPVMPVFPDLNIGITFFCFFALL